ncbi:6-aminohexanoate hydrolase [Rhodococcus sp. SC4]|uniref:serine hydrolase domain-containing protein n=1 Tax=Rhodococcus sp. LB1 TaxID=1807499 RepID=UPI000769FD93|nr:serine hydrolase [Rhodococcus sp. LB1]KXF52833.1 6-aminohexanoate hydrolase [Rhodococcus sp. SC4]KXX62332.1 6-aminohexanoate hydrolase [Rhodococcus sp. LB1]
MIDDTKTIVSLADWQSPPINRYTFGRMRQVVPSAQVAAGSAPLRLTDGDPLDLDLPVGTETLRSVLDRTYTDGFMVLHNGSVRAELYPGDLEPGRTHMLFSVSKSIVGTVAAHLIAAGLLDPEAALTEYIPELANSGYAGATVRHILDMRSGIRFSEEYLEPGAEVRYLDQAVGWIPRVDDWVPPSLYQFLPMLKAARPHGGPFEYRSCETDVLGWVCERAAADRMPALLSRLVWSKFAADDMDAGVDRAGAVFADGGLAATLRDVARFGEMLRRGGRIGAEQVVPLHWIDDSLRGAPDSYEAYSQSPTGTPFPGGMYRNQFWIPHPDRRVLLCLGIYGQSIYIDIDRGVVVVKLSSCPTPVNDELDNAAFAAAEAVAAALA